MRLLKSAVKSFFLPDKKRQIIFIDLLIFVIIVVPDKTAFLPVLRNCAIPKNLFILVTCIKIKNKNTLIFNFYINQKYFLHHFALWCPWRPLVALLKSNVLFHIVLLDRCFYLTISSLLYSELGILSHLKHIL